MGELNREKKLMDKSWIPLRLLENTQVSVIICSILANGMT